MSKRDPDRPYTQRDVQNMLFERLPAGRHKLAPRSRGQPGRPVLWLPPLALAADLRLLSAECRQDASQLYPAADFPTRETRVVGSRGESAPLFSRRRPIGAAADRQHAGHRAGRAVGRHHPGAPLRKCLRQRWSRSSPSPRSAWACRLPTDQVAPAPGCRCSASGKKRKNDKARLPLMAVP